MDKWRVDKWRVDKRRVGEMKEKGHGKKMSVRVIRELSKMGVNSEECEFLQGGWTGWGENLRNTTAMMRGLYEEKLCRIGSEEKMESLCPDDQDKEKRFLISLTSRNRHTAVGLCSSFIIALS